MKSTAATITILLIGCTAVRAQEVASPPAPKGELIVHGKDVPSEPVAMWTEEGKIKFLRGEAAAKAPAGAGQLISKHFDLRGPQIREVIFKKGSKFNPPGGKNDTVMFIISGHMKVKIGDLDGEVRGGDALREVAGTLTTFDVLEDTKVIETNVPPQT
jgi:hypothetical protein